MSMGLIALAFEDRAQDPAAEAYDPVEWKWRPREVLGVNIHGQWRQQRSLYLSASSFSISGLFADVCRHGSVRKIRKTNIANEFLGMTRLALLDILKLRAIEVPVVDIHGRLRQL
ncbi:hypothetical protein BU17DRAFT_70856 [Hysterangium stoloniferum]|nr:hypothetical protein BU17DRAFT_70856 [Hysterangium stoloniferum]